MPAFDKTTLVYLRAEAVKDKWLRFGSIA